jgi:hypothetical protein
MFVRVLFVLAGCLLVGCVTSASGPRFDTVQQKAIAPGQARLYVFRAKVLYLAQAPYIASAPILLDGRVVGSIANGGVLTADFPSDSRTVHSVVATAGSDQTGKLFAADAGSEVYVEVYDKTRMEGARAAPAAVVGGMVGGAATGVRAFVTSIADEARLAAALGEGRVWRVNFVTKADALPVISGLSLSE